MNKYPIYIVSKGRFENPITAKKFLKEKIPFKIVIEKQEYKDYSKIIPKENISILPFSNLGLGSFPARNWCWEDSLKNGFKKHHIFDDNIYGFYNLNKGKRIACKSLDAIIFLERFSEKFYKLGISGFNYDKFVTRETKKPFGFNVHVYSGMLINNLIPFRWRLKYNEDIDLCLQCLHNKWNTILLNNYLLKKVSTTSKMKGGNQELLYKGNKRELKILKAKSLEMIWPQYVKTKIIFNRPHHKIIWQKHFKHPLKLITSLN